MLIWDATRIFNWHQGSKGMVYKQATEVQTLQKEGFQFLLKGTSVQIKTILFEYILMQCHLYKDQQETLFQVIDTIFSLNNCHPI